MQKKPLSIIENPWDQITKSVRLLPCDKTTIENYNLKYSTNQIFYKDFPEPFLGNVNAEIYCLFGNPGFDLKNPLHDYSPKQIQSVLRNLQHRNGNDQFPFYLLDPLFEGHEGHKWWTNKLKPLADELNVGLDKIAKRLFAIEFYGYHSVSGSEDLIYQLKSFDYTEYIIKEAILKNKVILVCRGIRKWLTRIPDLKCYDNCFFVSSNRGIQLSQNTISPTGYKKLKNSI